jgi:hypothetical protein
MVQVTHEGTARTASMLAACLREEGLEVSYEPPLEHRGAVDVAELVVMIVSLPVVVFAGDIRAAAIRGVEKFKQKVPGATATVEDDEGADQ